MKRNSMMQLWLSLVLLTVILVVSVLFYIDNLNENFEREVFRTLEEVSSQEAMAIETEIQRKQDMLSDLSHVMEIDIDAEPDAILKSVHTQLQPIVEENGLRGMGVALEDGRAYSTRGEIMDIKDQEFYQRAWNGESVLSGRIILDRVAKDYVNVYATPIHDEKTGEVIGVLYATYNTRNFRATMDCLCGRNNDNTTSLLAQSIHCIMSSGFYSCKGCTGQPAEYQSTRCYNS